MTAIDALYEILEAANNGERSVRVELSSRRTRRTFYRMLNNNDKVSSYTYSNGVVKVYLKST